MLYYLFGTFSFVNSHLPATHDKKISERSYVLIVLFVFSPSLYNLHFATREIILTVACVTETMINLLRFPEAILLRHPLQNQFRLLNLEGPDDSMG